VLYWMITIKTPTQPYCGMHLLGLILISLTFLGIYSIGLLVKIVLSKDPTQRDYMIFLGVILIPVVIAGAYAMTNS